MPSSKHVQQCVADVLGELPMHGSAVIVFVAGNSLPNAVIGGRGGPAPGIESSQRRAIGILAIRKSIIRSGGILHHFWWRACHGRHGGGRGSQLPEPVRIHHQPVEDGTHVHVGAQLGSWVVGISCLVGEDHRIVDALLAPQQVVIDRHVHRAGDGLKHDFRLVAAVVGGVDSQGISGVRKGGPAGVIIVKRSAAPAVASGQKVRAVIDEAGDGSIGRVDDEGDDAVGQRDVGAVGRHRDIGSGAGATTGDVSLGKGGQ